MLNPRVRVIPRRSRSAAGHCPRADTSPILRLPALPTVCLTGRLTRHTLCAPEDLLRPEYPPLIPSLLHRLRDPALLLVAAIVLLCIGLQLAGLEHALRFDREAIAKGAVWRLLSGNLVHLGYSHLFMNMAGLALVVTLVWHHYSMLEWLFLTVFSSLCVGLGLYLLNPGILWYVGFSGTLHGLMLAGCLADLKSFPLSSGVLLALIIAKLVWEQYAGALPGSESVAGGRVMVDAHLYGAVSGAAAGALLLVLRRWRTAQTAP